MTQRENATDQSSHVAEPTQLRTDQRVYQLEEFLVWCAEAARPEACETVCRSSQLLLSSSVMSDSLWPHGLQHSRLPSPSPTPGVFPNSCPLSRWYHLTISFSVFPFSSCLQSFPSIRVFSNKRTKDNLLNLLVLDPAEHSQTSTLRYCRDKDLSRSLRLWR